MLYDIEALKARHPLEDVASRYLRLRPSGARLVALCPFHLEKTPSFTIDPRRQTYRCWGCGRSGDVIDFLEETEGLDFVDAVARLGGESVQGGANRHARPLCPQEPCVVALTPPRSQALTVALEWWQDTLWRTPAALAYLEARGLDRGAIKDAGLGYSAGGAELALRWSPGYLEAAHDLGVVDRYGRDRFTGRVIVPELRGGCPIWLTGRLLQAQPHVWGGDRKYLALTGIERPLLGYEAVASTTVFQGGGVLVCEGPFDRLAAQNWGYTAVALGGAWASAQARRELRILLIDKRCGYLVPDRDRAGRAGMLGRNKRERHAPPERQPGLLRRLDLPPEALPGVVRLPLDIKDLGELATQEGGQALFAIRLAQAHAAHRRASRERKTGQSCPPAGLHAKHVHDHVVDANHALR